MAIAEEWLKHAPKPRPVGDKEWNVFLSYRSVNRPWVLNLYDALREMGHKVFLDQTALKAGDRLIKGLQDALTTSQAGVLIWSSAARDSEWVEREYETLESQTTSRKGFRFVPVRLDRTPLPVFARLRIFLDFSDYPDGPNGGELLRLLHAVSDQALSNEAARFASEQDQIAQEAANKIRAYVSIGNKKLLMGLFDQGGLPWRTTASLGCQVAEGLTKLGHNTEALDVLQRLEVQFPKAIRPKQLRALALAREALKTNNATLLEEAQAIVAELYMANERDPETVGILARTWMDRYDREQEPTFLQKSRDLYAEAFEAARDDYYTGINAAAKSVLIGTPVALSEGAAYARRVLEIVGTEIVEGDYWKTATVAEAFLIEKKVEDAAKIYQAAVAMSPSETGSHGSTWRQASKLLAKLGATAEEQALVRQAFGRVGAGP